MSRFECERPLVEHQPLLSLSEAKDLLERTTAELAAVIGRLAAARDAAEAAARAIGVGGAEGGGSIAPSASAPPASAGPVSDEEPAHAAFERSMGRVVTAKVVRMFQSQIRDNFLVEERSALRGDAHRIAGTAGVLGFVRLGAAARQLEAACEEGGDYSPALSRIRAALREADTVLRAWSERLEAAPG